MHERVLPADQLDEQDIRVFRKLVEDLEDKASLGMGPPRRGQALAGDERHDIGEALVLFEENAELNERR